VNVNNSIRRGLASRARVLATTALVIAGFSGAGAQEQRPAFRTGSDTVRVYATVTDRSGRLVTNLTKEAFEVRDDGKAQPIVVFDNSPQPIQLIVLLDVSGSMQGNLPLLRAASRQLFTELGPKDVAKVGTFGREIVISPEFTRDVEKLTAALPTEILDAPTPLWKAIDQAMSAFDAKSESRRVVIVLSDGYDSPGPGLRIMTQVEVIDRARAEDVMVYGIGLRGRMAPQGGAGIAGMQQMMASAEPDPGLAVTAEETGGGYADVRPRDDLAAAFSQIARELHSQYLLGYDPPKRDGKKHKIEVRVATGGMEPRSRKSYVAPKGG
jgi:Ca-activated chloride channel homolog